MPNTNVTDPWAEGFKAAKSDKEARLFCAEVLGETRDGLRFLSQLINKETNRI